MSQYESYSGLGDLDVGRYLMLGVGMSVDVNRQSHLAGEAGGSMRKLRERPCSSRA